jgi:hypothetical protein
VAARRVLAAASELLDPGGSLVDAVTAWESMLGADRETTFAVTAAMAKLIGPTDTEGRLRLMARLKQIYRQRSALVHTGNETKKGDLREDQATAIDVALQSLRMLSEERHDLLPFASGERSTRLLLQG